MSADLDLKTKADERREAAGRGTFHGLYAEITETVIGAFFRFITSLAAVFWRVFITRL
jgi:hypothetical protein